MVFIIGGFAQGKLNYAKEKYGIDDEHVLKEVPEGGIFEGGADEAFIIDDINSWFRKQRERTDTDTLKQMIKEMIQRYPDIILISSEVGGGIIPADKAERNYREEMGRFQVFLAGMAKEVIRVVCGIGIKIK